MLGFKTSIFSCYLWQLTKLIRTRHLLIYIFRVYFLYIVCYLNHVADTTWKVSEESRTVNSMFLPNNEEKYSTINKNLVLKVILSHKLHEVNVIAKPLSNHARQTSVYYWK